MAIIYDMSDEEVVAHEQSKDHDQVADAVDIDEENKVLFLSLYGLSWADVRLQQSPSIPPHENITGYVTTGSFSLSLGEGAAIGAIPLAKLIQLQMQAKRCVVDSRSGPYWRLNLYIE